MLQGGCYCGRIRYEVTGTPFNETNCHCSICRRTTGAPFVAWFSVRPSEFRLLSGDPTSFRSSGKAVRTFCPHCGTQLTFQSEDSPEDIDVTSCSLDVPMRCPRRITPAPAASCAGLSWATGCPPTAKRDRTASAVCGRIAHARRGHSGSPLRGDPE